MNMKEWIYGVERRLAALEGKAEPQPEPAPHPLAGLEHTWHHACWWSSHDRNPPNDAHLRANYAKATFRDSTTKAPVPLWQVAKRLGKEHPVPDAVRWTDVEFSTSGSPPWVGVSRWWGKDEWDHEDEDRHFRLTAQYDHQEISYGQFREILGRREKPKPCELTAGEGVVRALESIADSLEDKPAEPKAVLYREDVECLLPDERSDWYTPSESSEFWASPHRFVQWKFRNRHTQQPITREQFIQATRNSEEREAKAKQAPALGDNDSWCGPDSTPDFRVGDLVEVTTNWSNWREGERFVAMRALAGGDLVDLRDTYIPPRYVRLISRRNP